MRHRVQGIMIQNGKAILGYGCVDKINKTFRHYFIGGGIETVETPEDAILREVMEAANVKGNIVFKFNKEIEKNSTTFLVDIGDQKPTLGYDPEEINEDLHQRSLQKLIFIPLKDKDDFTNIDINYFNVLLSECKVRNYYPKWYEELLELTVNY